MELHVKDSSDPTIGEAADFLLSPEERAKVQQNITEARLAQVKYLRDHPEIDELFAIALARMLRAQPADAETFLTDFFADNDLEAVVAEERRVTAEKKRISAEGGEEKMTTLF